MKAYKLTDSKNQTQNNTQWGENISHTATGKSANLCSDGWIHFYTNELIAVLLNSNHANFSNPHLLEWETEGEHHHEPLKLGCKTLTTIKQIPLPEISVTQRIAFGILCGKEVCHDEQWNKWADNWLNNTDRSYASAAADAAAAVHAACAADAAARAADAAWSAACAADAAARAADAGKKIDFIAIAQKAMTYS